MSTDTLLVIEVSDSSLKNDRTDKSDLHAEAGVLEYWVVDVAGNLSDSTSFCLPPFCRRTLLFVLLEELYDHDGSFVRKFMITG